MSRFKVFCLAAGTLCLMIVLYLLSYLPYWEAENLMDELMPYARSAYSDTLSQVNMLQNSQDLITYFENGGDFPSSIHFSDAFGYAFYSMQGKKVYGNDSFSDLIRDDLLYQRLSAHQDSFLTLTSFDSLPCFLAAGYIRDTESNPVGIVYVRNPLEKLTEKVVQLAADKRVLLFGNNQEYYDFETNSLIKADSSESFSTLADALFTPSEIRESGKLSLKNKGYVYVEDNLVFALAVSY